MAIHKAPEAEPPTAAVHTKNTFAQHTQPARKPCADMASNNLPSLEHFLDERIRQQAQDFGATDDTNCAICLDGMQVDSQEPSTRLAQLPCQHILHLHCLLNMTQGYTDNRNKCPSCRQELFELKLLPPVREALARKEKETYYDRDASFDTKHYTELLTITDNLFDEQRRLHATGAECYVGIPKRVCASWIQTGLQRVIICEMHAAAESAWLELEVARRVEDQLRHASMLENWSGRIFMGALEVMQDMFEEQFQCSDDEREPEDRVSVMDEDDEDDEGSEEEHERPNPQPLRGSMNEIFGGALATPWTPTSRDYRPIEQSPSPPRATPPQRSTQSLPPPSPDTTLMVEDWRRETQSAPSAASSPTFSHTSSDDRFAAGIINNVRQQNQSAQQRFLQTRERLRRDRDIVLELRNVASAEIYGNRARRIKLLSGVVIGIVRDVDGYDVVGSMAMFWRWKAQG